MKALIFILKVLCILLYPVLWIDCHILHHFGFEQGQWLDYYVHNIIYNNKIK